MIKLNTNFEKNKLNKDRSEDLLLLELAGIKTKIKKYNHNEKQKLNLSVSIDISSSMGLKIGNDNAYQSINMGNGLFGRGIEFNNECNIQPTRLDMAKKAAIKAVNKMENGDIISIVVFDHEVKVIIPATILNNENRTTIVNRINELSPRGATNVHGGWLAAATEVAKNLNNKSMNRVLLLTDGQTNNGIRDVDVISSDVLSLFEKSISVSTFGIGDDFNEVLLESMSNAGGGNFYYIEKEENFDSMFEEEFTGLDNICGYDIKLFLDLNENITISNEYNDLTKKDNYYVVPSVNSINNLSLLYKIKTKNLIESKDFNAGKVILEYKDNHGNQHQDTIDLIIDITNQKDWDSLDNNEEVKVQEVILTVAKNKIEATRAIQAGNVELAKTVLFESSNYIASSNLSDSRLGAETTMLQGTLSASDSMSNEKFKKHIFTQSYNTRNGKN
jgi:Ca-activated chloride channel family protein